MRFDERDRRRLGLASVLTIVALPTVWLTNRDDPTTGPSIAAVGLAAGDAPATSAPPVAADPMGDVEAKYLEARPAPPDGRPVDVAVGSPDSHLVAVGHAIFRRSIGDVDACRVAAVDPGQLITVVNVENGRTTECWTNQQRPDAPAGELVLHPDRFAEIADLTSAPVDIEIRQ